MRESGRERENERGFAELLEIRILETTESVNRICSDAQSLFYFCCNACHHMPECVRRCVVCLCVLTEKCVINTHDSANMRETTDQVNMCHAGRSAHIPAYVFVCCASVCVCVCLYKHVYVCNTKQFITVSAELCSRKLKN